MIENEDILINLKKTISTLKWSVRTFIVRLNFRHPPFQFGPLIIPNCVFSKRTKDKGIKLICYSAFCDFSL